MTIEKKCIPLHGSWQITSQRGDESLQIVAIILRISSDKHIGEKWIHNHEWCFSRGPGGESLTTRMWIRSHNNSLHKDRPDRVALDTLTWRASYITWIYSELFLGIVWLGQHSGFCFWFPVCFFKSPQALTGLSQFVLLLNGASFHVFITVNAAEDLAKRRYLLQTGSNGIEKQGPLITAFGSTSIIFLLLFLFFFFLTHRRSHI